jgi:plasmid stability protein
MRLPWLRGERDGVLSASAVACIDCNDYIRGMRTSTHRRTTTLTIRNVDVGLREQLRVRAAGHGHSMEAELRAILRETLGRDQVGELDMGEAIRRRFAPFGGVELESHPPVAIGQPPRFDE